MDRVFDTAKNIWQDFGCFHQQHTPHEPKKPNFTIPNNYWYHTLDASEIHLASLINIFNHLPSFNKKICLYIYTHMEIESQRAPYRPANGKKQNPFIDGPRWTSWPSLQALISQVANRTHEQGKDRNMISISMKNLNAHMESYAHRQIRIYIYKHVDHDVV